MNLDIRILYDNQRHLIAVPYSKENLHRAAELLGIKRCWFHKDHYDVPKRMMAIMPEWASSCGHVIVRVSVREIAKIVRGGK